MSDPRWLHWAPDGESVLVSGSGGKVGRTVRVSLESGEVDPVLEFRVRGGPLSPDGRTLYTSGGVFGVVSYDLETGNETVLLERDEPEPGQGPFPERGMFIADLSISPDGHTLAIADARLAGEEHDRRTPVLSEADRRAHDS